VLHQCYSNIIVFSFPGILLTSTPSPSASFSSSPDLHYAVVIDAGSSGSRAYLYSWPDHSGDPHELLKISPMTDEGKGRGNPLYKKVSPGISSLSSHPQDALEYITPLLEFAERHIPSSKWSETPLYILATAGMRLLEKSRQEEIIRRLREGVHGRFKFLFPEGNLEVITGKQEGIYQWLAINYVLGKFDHGDPDELVALKEEEDGVNEDLGSVAREGGNLVLRPRTVGALDMGGASMQIAMEITSPLQMRGMKVSIRQKFKWTLLIGRQRKEPRW